jgi:hypothetical protein
MKQKISPIIKALFAGSFLMRLSSKVVTVIGVSLGVSTGALYCGVAQAQPSDAQIKKDISGPGILSVKLLGRGSRVWNTAHRLYVWDRSAVVVRKACIPEYPNAKLEIGGIASYSIVGGRFPFRKFLVTYNSYSGIPAPSSKAVIGLINKDLPEFLGHAYYSIVGPVQPIAIASEPKWDWHTPNSVSVRVTTGYRKKVSSTQVENKKAVATVRLYRDAIKKPWTKFMASGQQETTLGVTTYKEDVLSAMKTLNIIDAERSAKARLAALPAVQVPSFKTDLELFAWLNQILREGNPKKTEAVLRRTLSPSYFEKGSTVLLNSQGEELVNAALRNAYEGRISYAEQYPANLNVSHYQPNSISFWNADGRHMSSMSAELTGGTWQNGVKVGQRLKLKELSIAVLKDADEIARLRSLPPATRFAPPRGSTPFSQLGQQVVAEQQAQAQVEVVRAIQWAPFTSDNGRFTVSFPAKPTETQGQMNDKYPMWTAEAGTDKVLCRVVSIIYPTRLNRMQAQSTVEAALRSLVESNNVTVKIQSELMSGTYGKIATLEGDGKVMQVQINALNNVLYQLIVSGSPATMANLDYRQFFNSFQPLR